MSALKFFCFWPGLASAWHQGSAKGLFVAVTFAWSLCVILLANFVWPDWLSNWFLNSLFAGTAIFWLTMLVKERFLGRPDLSQGEASSDDLLTLAQTEYLRGNWFEAEAHLLKILSGNPGDVPASLLMVGVLRRTQRSPAALQRIEQICLYDAAAAWRFELECEKQLIARASENRSENEPAEQSGETRPEVQEEDVRASKEPTVC